MSDSEAQVLKLVPTFCPDSQVDKFDLIKDVHLFARRLMYKVIFDKPPAQPATSVSHVNVNDNIAEHHALAELMDLWEEGHVTDDESWLGSPPTLSVAGMSLPPPPSSLLSPIQDIFHF